MTTMTVSVGCVNDLELFDESSQVVLQEQF